MPNYNPKQSKEFLAHIGKGRSVKGYRKVQISIPDDIFELLESQPDKTRSDAVIRIIREWEMSEKIRNYKHS